ncbi:MAG: hypothetical protein A3F84_13195 [Candidatus Handelsmanbacteria bacterium RIFCSPLOWO2_12_FULL_64_10]|uniref:Uncharacterized protein n=1 Tax=Handelsmanbacteria sp. (strain RIFCSPLOWO2_12_FULL_64_10) TaxID=1817868 RepID=A0A1F6D0B9_HANXR|nr:MAG: hypothetical protein A3F84_13195 [Candidatus Handelsmanbacteria bacterium RIFCSPLOWO2_12_FULL_64_10]
MASMSMLRLKTRRRSARSGPCSPHWLTSPRDSSQGPHRARKLIYRPQRQVQAPAFSGLQTQSGVPRAQVSQADGQVVRTFSKHRQAVDTSPFNEGVNPGDPLSVFVA